LTRSNAVTKYLQIIFLIERDKFHGRSHVCILMEARGYKSAATAHAPAKIGGLKSKIQLVLESHAGKNISPRGPGFVIDKRDAVRKGSRSVNGLATAHRRE